MQIFLKNQTDIFEDVVKQDALGNRQSCKRWQIKGGLTFKACSHDPFLRIRFLLVPKNESCEHMKDDLPSNGSLILQKRMEIEHALFSSDTLLER